MLSAIIIDDQEICTEMLLDVLQSGFPEVKVVAVAHSGEEGIRAIKDLKPDLVILDVEMPGITGIEMLRKIGNPDFEVIFVTAHDQYSIEALRLSALDYLVKPVDRVELRSAIDRISHNRSKEIGKQIHALAEYLKERKQEVHQVAIPSGDGLVFINAGEIVHCDSDSNYTTLHLVTGQKLMVTKTLKDVESLLPAGQFFRIHHSHLINLNHIKKYVRGNAGYVIMSSGSNINVARNKKEEFLNRFSHL
jgi:two-component system, LytTR family, response regulator